MFDDLPELLVHDVSHDAYMRSMRSMRWGCYDMIRMIAMNVARAVEPLVLMFF